MIGDIYQLLLIVFFLSLEYNAIGDINGSRFKKKYYTRSLPKST